MLLLILIFQISIFAEDFCASLNNTFGTIKTSTQFERIPIQPYIQNRSFDDYDLFSQRQLSKVLKQKPEPIWLDAGSGTGTALRQHLEQNKNSKAIGIIRESPLRPFDWYSFSERERLKWFQGWKIEDIANAEIGEVDIITDILGPFVYSSEHPDRILKKYLQLLRPGGHLFLALQNRSIVIDHEVEFTIARWLQHQVDWKNSKVEVHYGFNMIGTIVPTMFIVELSEESRSIHIPSLKKKNHIAKTLFPPAVVYEVQRSFIQGPVQMGH